MTPSKSVFRICIKDVATGLLVVIRNNSKNHNMCYAFNAAMKGGYHHMVKKISWHDFENELHVVTLDSYVCDDTHHGTAHALDYMFRKLDLIDGAKIKFNGQGTDSGLGGLVMVCKDRWIC